MSSRALWSWERGPAGRDGPVVVSFTCLTLHRARHRPGAVRAGLRLRAGWYAMPGAVGLWLWAQPLQGRSGSVSVWRSEEDLRRFVGLPLHVEIMKRYRPRGVVWAKTWQAERFDPVAIKSEARRLLAA